MGLKVGTVKIEKYNPEWKKIFEEERDNLQKIFKDLALGIEHVGSTSVVGLSSKPIIDIAVGLKKLTDFEKVKVNFSITPYSIKEDSVSDEILVRKGNEENRTHFIHVMEIDGKRYKDTILFRNYLREHKEMLEEYEKLKIELANKYPNDRKLYTQSKNDFIQRVIELASK